MYPGSQGKGSDFRYSRRNQPELVFGFFLQPWRDLAGRTRYLAVSRAVLCCQVFQETFPSWHH